MNNELAAFGVDEFESDVRVDVLRRLAEQAMSDPSFREVARDDLEKALQLYGYDLNENEMALVLRFRAALAEAGIDLFLTERLTPDQQTLLHQVLS